MPFRMKTPAQHAHNPRHTRTYTHRHSKIKTHTQHTLNTFEIHPTSTHNTHTTHINHTQCTNNAHTQTLTHTMFIYIYVHRIYHVVQCVGAPDVLASLLLFLWPYALEVYILSICMYMDTYEYAYMYIYIYTYI